MKDPVLIRRRRLFWLALPLLAVTLSTVAGELFVRLTSPQPVTTVSKGLFEPDPPRRFRLAPGYRGTISNVIDFHNEVTINSLGLRGPEVPPKPTGGFRILSIGDSFAFGYGVEPDESYAGVLEAHLRTTQLEIECLNGGVPGYGVPDAVDWLETYGLDLKPDLVLLSVYLGNDIMDATQKSREDGFSFLFPGAGPMRGPLLWLYGHSHAFRLGLRNDFKGVRAVLGLPDPPVIDAMREMAQSFSSDTDLGREGRSANLTAFSQLLELADRQGFHLAAMIIPSRFMLESDYREAVLTRLGMDAKNHDPEAPWRFFQESFAAFGIPTLDMTPAIQQALANSDPVYFKADPHWSAAGHRLAGDALHRFLISEDLIGQGLIATERVAEDLTPASSSEVPATEPSPETAL